MRTALDCLTAALAGLLCWLVLQAAPVPPPRPAPAPALAGAWVAYWGGVPWHTTLLEGGAYAAERDGGRVRFEGTWRLDAPVLVIEEALVTTDGVGAATTYRFALKRGTTASACGRLRLVRP